jgi:hypothetical protein
VFSLLVYVNVVLLVTVIVNVPFIVMPLLEPLEQQVTPAIVTLFPVAKLFAAVVVAV